MPRDRGLTFSQITPQRSVTGSANAFGNGGIHEYRLSVGGGKRWDPSRSYLQLTARLWISDGATPPTLSVPTQATGIAFADSPVGNCFQSCALQAGSVDIGQVNSFQPQISIINTRLNRTGAWLASIGADSFGLVADFGKRLTNISDAVPGISVASTVTGTTDVADAPPAVLRPLVTGVGVGLVTGIPSYISGRTLSDGNTQTFLWRPPLGIFDAEAPLPAGSYTLQLNPDTVGWQRGMVESLVAKTPGTNYVIDVVDCRFYACMIDDIAPAVSEVTLESLEVMCVTKTLDPGASQSNLEFSVPPSTYAIGIAFQGTEQGTSSEKSISRFWAEDTRSELGLDNIQVTYGNVSKPAQSYSSANGLKQRWYDSLVHQGDDQSGGGVEPYKDWLIRGPLLYFSFEREAMDRSTQVNVQCKFDNLAQTATNKTNLLVFAFHKRATAMVIDRGFITDVKSLAV